MRLNDLKKFVPRGRKKKQKRLESKAKQRKRDERRGIGEIEEKKENHFFSP